MRREPENKYMVRSINVVLMSLSLSLLPAAHPILQKCVFSLKEEKRKSLRWRKEFEKKQRLARESLLDANTSISSTTDSEDDEMETIQGYVSREHVHTSRP